MEVIPLLTQKQEKYVQNLVAGMSQREAYKDAYNALKMKDSTIDEKASRLLSQDKVRARYDDLMGRVRDEADAAAVASALEVLQELSAIALGKKEYPSLDIFGNPVDRPVSVGARLKALELMAKKYGLLTDKVEHSGNIHIEVSVDED